MKYYTRTVFHREVVNNHGRLGYVKYREYFKSSDKRFIEKMNKGKHIKFYDVPKSPEYIHIEKNRLYEERIQ